MNLKIFLCQGLGCRPISKAAEITLSSRLEKQPTARHKNLGGRRGRKASLFVYRLG